MSCNRESLHNPELAGLVVSSATSANHQGRLVPGGRYIIEWSQRYITNEPIYLSTMRQSASVLIERIDSVNCSTTQCSHSWNAPSSGYNVDGYRNSPSSQPRLPSLMALNRTEYALIARWWDPGSSSGRFCSAGQTPPFSFDWYGDVEDISIVSTLSADPTSSGTMMPTATPTESIGSSSSSVPTDVTTSADATGATGTQPVGTPAGVVVAAVLGSAIAVLASCLLFWYLRQRRRQAAGIAGANGGEVSAGDKANRHEMYSGTAVPATEEEGTKGNVSQPQTPKP